MLGLVQRKVDWDSENLGCVPNSVTDLLGDLGTFTSQCLRFPICTLGLMMFPSLVKCFEIIH